MDRFLQKPGVRLVQQLHQQNCVYALLCTDVVCRLAFNIANTACGHCCIDTRILLVDIVAHKVTWHFQACQTCTHV